MTAPDLSVVLAQMWATFAPLARTRVEALETYAAALAAGRDDPQLRAPAAVAAHKLAGALGSYARPGSDDAAALELLLREDGAERDAAVVGARVAALRVAVGA
jgi:Hpt domain